MAGNSLTGADIDETTLLGVNADRVNGVRAFEIDYRSEEDPPFAATILQVASLLLQGTCTGGDLEVFARTTTVNDTAMWVFADNNALAFRDLDVIDGAVDIVNLDDNTAGTFVFARPDGIHVTVNFIAEEDPFGTAPQSDCVFAGTALLTS